MFRYHKKTFLITLALCAAAALALYFMTEISHSNLKRLHKNKVGTAVQALLPADDYKELSVPNMDERDQKVRSAFAAMDADGQVLGYVAFVTVKGYNGPMEVDVAMDASGEKVEGVQIGAHGETEGLGAKAASESFLSQFHGVTPPTALDEIKAVSGATVTSEAVVSAVNLAADFTKEAMKQS